MTTISTSYFGWLAVASDAALAPSTPEVHVTANPRPPSVSDQLQSSKHLQVVDVGNGEIHVRRLATLQPRSGAAPLSARSPNEPPTFAEANQRRIQLLEHAARTNGWSALPAPAAADPEDMSAHPARAAIALENPGELDRALLHTYAALLEVGQHEGFAVQGGFSDPAVQSKLGAKAKAAPNRHNIRVGDDQHLYIEDVLNATSHGTANVLPLLRDNPAGYDKWIRQEQMSRQLVAGGFGFSIPPDAGREEAFAHALEAGLQPRVAYAYCEGGNQLTGALPDGQAYAVVSNDCIASTHYLIESELGQDIGDDTARLLLAKDLGLPVAHVHFVRQPGAYHLDLRMILAEPGVVWLNDSVQGVPLELRLMDKAFEADNIGERRPPNLMEKLNTLAQAQSHLESQTEQDLLAGGLHVKRVPGVMRGPMGIAYDMSGSTLFNGEMGRNPNGQPYYITLGNNADSEAHFLEAIKDSNTPLRVYFLHPGEAHNRLLEKGAGLDCVTRMIGQ